MSTETDHEPTATFPLSDRLGGGQEKQCLPVTGFKIGPAERGDSLEKLEAELAEWRQGPWVRKADHDEAVSGFSAIAKKYHAAETELGRLRAAVIMFRDAKGGYQTQLAADRLFSLVAQNEEVPA